MDRQSLASRIRALLSKTTENGATEAEAMAAAEKARELMDKYHLDMGEVGMEAEGVIKATAKRDAYKTLQIKNRIAARVAEFCDCKVWYNGPTLIFFGLRSDADFATWLIESLDQFIRTSAVQYMAGNPTLPTGVKMPRWEAEKAFLLGAINRINQRLNETTIARQQEMRAQAGTGRSLVVVKGSIVAKAFASLNMRLGSGRGYSASARDGGAFAAGKAAGDRASFGRPVNSGGGVRLIGR